MPDFLWLQRLRYVRLPCPSLSPGFCSNHVHWVGDAIQPSHPLPSPSPLALNLSQHQGLVKWVSSSHQVAKVLELQHHSVQCPLQGWFPLGFTGLISLVSKGLSRIFPSPQFKSISSLALSLLYSPSITSIHDYWKNHSFDYMDLCQQTNISAF